MAGSDNKQDVSDAVVPVAPEQTPLLDNTLNVVVGASVCDKLSPTSLYRPADGFRHAVSLHSANGRSRANWDEAVAEQRQSHAGSGRSSK